MKRTRKRCNFRFCFLRSMSSSDDDDDDDDDNNDDDDDDDDGASLQLISVKITLRLNTSLKFKCN